MTHHVLAVAREKVILAIFKLRALMWAAVHERADDIAPAYNEEGVGTCAVWVKTARADRRELIETAQADGTCDVAQCFSGGPPGNHFSRELNRNSCELSAPIGTARATQEPS